MRETAFIQFYLMIMTLQVLLICSVFSDDHAVEDPAAHKFYFTGVH